MEGRLRRTYGYWLKVVALQWPGMLYRAALRLRCEADPSAYASSPAVAPVAAPDGGSEASADLATLGNSSNGSGTAGDEA